MELIDQLAKKAMEINPVERIRLVEAILYSLDKPDSDIEQSWASKSEARYDAISDVIAHIEAELEDQVKLQDAA